MEEGLVKLNATDWDLVGHKYAVFINCNVHINSIVQGPFNHHIPPFLVKVTL